MSQQTILNFLIPPKPDHPNISGRLDILAKYGPIVNYHLLDKCICVKCRPTIRSKLLESGKTLKTAKDKVITEDFINHNTTIFCKDCLNHFTTWSHLLSGHEGTHIMTNEEIDFMIHEMNKNDIYEILLAEKGTAAKTIITKYDIKKPPKETIYKKEHVLKLLSILKTDDYGRYDYIELQNLILEDRRIRLNWWVSKMIDKPMNQFANAKLLNFTGDEKEIKDIMNPKSKNFTLLRNKPIEIKNQERKKLQNTVLQHPIMLKGKLTEHEIESKIERLLTKNISMINGDDLANINIKNNMLLLRNYELEAIKSKEGQEDIKKERERLNQLKYG